MADKAFAVAPRSFHGSPCPLVVVGAWQLSAGHSSRVDDQAPDDSAAALAAHAEAGLRCFDCADIYTGVEDLLGRVGRRCPEIRVHTKCVPDLDAMTEGRVSREYLEAGIVRSLNRLGTDALDLVQFHWWDFEVPGFEQAYGELCKLQAAGLVRAVGLTNTDLPHLRRLVEAGHAVASNQVQLSLLDRRPLSSGMAAFCEEHGIELLCYGSLAGGFLTDRWLGREDPGFGSLENRSLTKYRLIIDEYGSWEDFQRLLKVLDQVAKRRGTDIASVAVGWVLRQRGPTRAILGARGAEHASGMAAAAEVRLSDEDMEVLNREVDGRGIQGEVFEAERSGGRHTGIMRRNLNGIGTVEHVAECTQRAKNADNGEAVAIERLRREMELLRHQGQDVTAIEVALTIGRQA